MKILARLSFICVLLFCLAACYSLIPPSDPTSPPNTNQQDAENALVEFFQYLHKGDYEAAADLYGGSYEWLIDVNPDIRSADYPALLKRGCQQNGLSCLEARSAEAVLMHSSIKYTFQVEFKLDDGSLFAQEYCCNPATTDKPPISKFHFRVQKAEDGSWQVLDLPPYGP